jgi:hypothetical protein
MRVIATECSKEQQKKDMPELVKMHTKALNDPHNLMWGFFGGWIKLPNGNKYQVVE